MGRGTGPTRNSGKGNPALAVASLLLAVFFVGTDVVSVKYALEGFPPLVLMPIRYRAVNTAFLCGLRPVGTGENPEIARSRRGSGTVLMRWGHYSSPT